MNNSKAKAGIIGASGYAGYELIKLISGHKNAELVVLNSRKHEGERVSSLYNDFNDDNLKFTNHSVEEINSMELDAIFLATPSGVALKTVPQLNLENTRVIDLSADYRFKDAKKFEEVYGIKHDGRSEAVYGLPEMFRNEIKNAQLVANPGCYSTACLLAALPLRERAGRIIFDCKSGWSGAGKESVYARDPSVIKDNLIAYKLARHRHKYEIEQFISNTSFTPHVIDTFRGMMCTAHIMLDSSISRDEAERVYRDYYSSHPLVRVEESAPEMRSTQNSSMCTLGGFESDESKRLVVISTIDNLLKGASGQAVQNMNIMLGFEETEGLVRGRG